jgi:hypothetical protein
MQAKQFVPSLAVIVLMAALNGCAGGTRTVETATGRMPEYCVYNNTASGAAVGAGAGAALGGGGLRSLVGAAIGAGAGAAAGAEQDAECRQIALQQAMQLAARQAAAAREAEAAREAAAQAAAQQAMVQNQPPPPPPQPVAYEPVAYEPVDYVTPSNHKRHRIQALKNFTNPVSKQVCNTYQEFTFTEDGKPRVSGTGTACKGSDGTWHG